MAGKDSKENLSFDNQLDLFQRAGESQKQCGDCAEILFHSFSQTRFQNIRRAALERVVTAGIFKLGGRENS